MSEIALSKIKPNPNNPRLIKDDKFGQLVKSIRDFPEMLKLRPIVVNEDMMVLGGNMRLKACKEAGLKKVHIEIAEGLSEDQQKEFIIKDNSNFGSWDFDLLVNEWDQDKLDEWGVDVPVEWVGEEDKGGSKKLSDRFIIPPFSVLNTMQGAWQHRKNYWLSLGIKSEVGRSAPSITNNDVLLSNGISFSGVRTDGTSIFDPVLCELCYQWFNIPKGKILDPFAGGSVRGIVASILGFKYMGNDLSKEQITANRANAEEVLTGKSDHPDWTNGDSLNINTITKGYEADMIFSCPPYSDLEVYSDLKEDISNMGYSDFIDIYREIIKKSCELLKDDRFAVFVVGDIRSKKGNYRNFVSDTTRAFIDCGLVLYNEMILVNSIGNLQMRVGRYMKSRKVGKQHQNVLVFYKGNIKNIKNNYPELDFGYVREEVESN